MNVHLVTPGDKPDWIIVRLAKHLRTRHDWSMSHSPTSRADVNIFFPYLLWRFTSWAKTATVGWFTHDETTVSTKSRIWAKTAPVFDLRVAMAKQYADALEQYGPTVHITPPIELKKFRLCDQPRRERPAIGVCGEVYPGGRKGEGLVKRLAGYNKHRWAIRAAGKGWPVPTRYYDWSRMERFYHDLDVFLCTSTIEGGPVTVLEALACGRPVVVPRGVGLIPELPESPGIWRYDAGDYRSMVDAIEEALDNPVEPGQLRAYVEDHTIERWCIEWYTAVHDLIHGKELPMDIGGPLPDWRENAGVYIVAYGKRALDCAALLIRTIRKRMPMLKICVAVEQEIDLGADVYAVSPMKDKRARSQKTKIQHYIPEDWHYALYLDADMLLVGGLEAFFEPLQDGWDMVFTLSPPPSQQHPHSEMIAGAQRMKYKEENAFTNSFIGSNKYLQFAGGAWSFRRNARTEAFLRMWHMEWKRYQKTDQQSMMRALWRSGVRFWALPSQFNWFVHRAGPPKDAAVLHFATAARAWVEKHDGRRLWREWKKRV